MIDDSLYVNNRIATINLFILNTQIRTLKSIGD